MHLSSSLQFGGLERIIRNFAAYLDRKEYEFSACALDADGVFGEEIRAMGLPVFVLGKKPGVDTRLPLALYRLFRRERIDVVHTHNFAPLLYASIPARLAGVKVLVHTEHARTNFPDTKRRMRNGGCHAWWMSSRRSHPRSSGIWCGMRRSDPTGSR